MNGFDSDSKMKAMKAIMDYADESEDNDLVASSGKKPHDSSGDNEGFLDEEGSFAKNTEDEDEDKKKSGGMGGMGGMDLSSLMSMFGGSK